ncbi:hypothetical protein BST97_04360 [Nonlabens spongiae]|uniref:Uncharacterized protein n=1 Tax=Nonlabens spongiae TaxID=331648 RepID=A0A1W6MI51_9FLAO|nr:hypothetical protein [Nonlabens spongiae]ARN77275.1 hypothetical protein BST97_04360 [Nonlabens spongiae]
MNKNHFKTIRFYVLGISCILAYFYLENASLIPDLIETTSKGRYSGFPTFFITGMIKYGLLVYGVLSIVVLTLLLVRRRN